jgi:hypothetical protein
MVSYNCALDMSLPPWPSSLITQCATAHADIDE